MKPTILLDRATTPDGKPLTLHQHDGAFIIRVDGVELMSTRQHHSEERLAETVLSRMGGHLHGQRILIGGLGLGFTLRAALRHVGSDARVIVAEIVPAVVRWNRTAEYGLGSDALADPRVDVVIGDVADVMRKHPGWFDAVILDVDNGASGLSTAANDSLYTPVGLATARTALRPGGCLAIWSAEDDPACIRRMRRCGFDVVVERARTRVEGGGWNHLFIGRLTGPADDRGSIAPAGHGTRSSGSDRRRGGGSPPAG